MMIRVDIYWVPVYYALNTTKTLVLWLSRFGGSIVIPFHQCQPGAARMVTNARGSTVYGTLNTQCKKSLKYQFRKPVTFHTNTKDNDAFLCCYLPLSCLCFYFLWGPHDGAVGWGTPLQAGRMQVWFQMVWLEFCIDIFLPAAIWTCGRLSL
jgi:hypothetical protein